MMKGYIYTAAFFVIAATLSFVTDVESMSIPVNELNEDHELHKRSGAFDIRFSSPGHGSYWLGMRAGYFDSLTSGNGNIEWSIVNFDGHYGNIVFCGEAPGTYYWQYNSATNKVVVSQVTTLGNAHKFKFEGVASYPYKIHPYDAATDTYVEYDPDSAPFLTGLNVVTENSYTSINISYE